MSEASQKESAVSSTSNHSLPSPNSSAQSTPENELPSPTAAAVASPTVKSKLQAPPGAIDYLVQSSETLESISAKFDVTPSELVKLNKLPLRMVFPGQRIFVPDPSLKKPEIELVRKKSANPPLLLPTNILLQKSSTTSEKLAVFPGHIEAVLVKNNDTVSTEMPSDVSAQGGEELRLDEECHARFLKINASYVIEDQGNVSGVLLVTPNAIMFDPNVSDPLVVEHGTDKYGMIIPMENILSAAIYSEIVPPKVRRASHIEPIPLSALLAEKAFHEPNVPEEAPVLPAVTEVAPTPEPKVADFPPSTETDKNDHVTGNLTTVLETPTNKDGSDLSLKSPPADDSSKQQDIRRRMMSPHRKASSKNSSDEMVDLETAPVSRRDSLAPLRKLSRTLMGREPKSRNASDSDDSTSLTSQIQSGILQRAGSLRGTVSPKLKSFVDYSSGLFQYTDEVEGGEKLQSQSSEEASSPLPGESFTSWQLRRGLSREDVLQAATVRRQKFGYKSVVTVEDKPELFKSIEELIPHTVPSTAKPLYLCFRVGTPLDRHARPINPPVEAYGRKRLKPEYWFAIERDKAEKFYAFLLHWRPEVYGTENMDPADLGFMLFDEPDEHMNEHFAKDLRGMAKEWEVIAFDEARRRAFFLEREEPVVLPELIGGSSDILNDEICRSLVPHLPARAQGYPWNLIYSTSAHGFSLKTLYRKMQSIDAPTLFIIKDVNGHVFGAVLSCAFKVSEHFYGTGESLLFTFCPEFKVYNWNGVNEYIVRCQLENIVVGSGGGTFGLWLDEDFYHGRTQTCTTFDNDPLCSCCDFTVKAVEAWCLY